MARRLYPAHLEIAFVASLFVAWQPVLTSVNAGITPDAFANALSAWALYLVARGLSGDGSWPALLGAALFAAAAFAFKDTAFGVFGAVTVAAVAHAWRRRKSHLWAFIGGATVVGATVLAAATINSRHIDDALERVRAVQLDVLTLSRLGQLVAHNAVPGFVSFWTTFGNFGAHEIRVVRLDDCDCVAVRLGGRRLGSRTLRVARVERVFCALVRLCHGSGGRHLASPDPVVGDARSR